MGSIPAKLCRTPKFPLPRDRPAPSLFRELLGVPERADTVPFRVLPRPSEQRSGPLRPQARDIQPPEAQHPEVHSHGSLPPQVPARNKL